MVVRFFRYHRLGRRYPLLHHVSTKNNHNLPIISPTSPFFLISMISSISPLWISNNHEIDADRYLSNSFYQLDKQELELNLIGTGDREGFRDEKEVVPADRVTVPV